MHGLRHQQHRFLILNEATANTTPNWTCHTYTQHTLLDLRAVGDDGTRDDDSQDHRHHIHEAKTRTPLTRHGVVSGGV